jgi:hypothetical protein
MAFEALLLAFVSQMFENQTNKYSMVRLNREVLAELVV